MAKTAKTTTVTTTVRTPSGPKAKVLKLSPEEFAAREKRLAYNKRYQAAKKAERQAERAAEAAPAKAKPGRKPKAAPVVAPAPVAPASPYVLLPSTPTKVDADKLRAVLEALRQVQRAAPSQDAIEAYTIAIAVMRQLVD